MNEPLLICLGYCGADYACLVPSIPLDGKTEILELRIVGGGPAATAAVTAARQGARTAFCGAVGSDEWGRLVLDEFRRENVDTSAVAVRHGAESAVSFCWAERGSGRRSIAWARGSAAPLEPEELDFDRLKQASILHLDGHQIRAAIAAAEAVRSAGGLVSLDGGTLRPQMLPLLERCDIAIVSEAFATALQGGRKEPEHAIETLLGRGPRIAGVTLGARGAIASDGNRIVRQPAFALETVDTTGAGDVFHGAFCVAWLERQSLQESMRFAAAAAALKCRQLGGRAGIPFRAELDRFLKQKA